MVRRVYLPALIGLVGAVGTIATKRLDGNWATLTLWVQLGYVGVGAASAASAVLAAWNGVEVIREKRRNDIYTALLAAITKIMGVKKVSLNDLGLSAYRVRGWIWKTQVREVRCRFSNFPPSSTIAWTKGKGVIGRCWDAGFHQAEFERAKCGYVNVTKAQWDSIEETDRMGLTFEEWQATVRYALIMAHPVTRGDRYIGCVTLDTTNEKCARQLLCKPVWNQLADAAAAVAKAL